MTKAELIAALAEYPEDAIIAINDKYRVGMVDAAKVYPDVDYPRQSEDGQRKLARYAVIAS